MKPFLFALHQSWRAGVTSRRSRGYFKPKIWYIYVDLRTLQVRQGGERNWNIANLTDVNLNSICYWAIQLTTELLCRMCDSDCVSETVRVTAVTGAGGEEDWGGRDVVLAGASVPRAEWPCHNNYTSEGASVPRSAWDSSMLSLFIAH